MNKEKSAKVHKSSPMPFWREPSGKNSAAPWELSICGDLSERQSDLIEKMAEVPRASRGIIYFDSCGGSVYTGLALGSLMRLRRLKVTGIVLGECSSAALIPFAACQKRFVTTQCTLLFHPMRWQSDEDVRLEEATEWARHFKSLESQVDALLVSLLHIAPETLQSWTRPGKFVSGPELAQEGLASLFDPFTEPDPWKTVTTQ